MSDWPLVWISWLVGFVFFLQLPVLLFLASPVVPFCTSPVYSLEPWFFYAQYIAFNQSKKKMVSHLSALNLLSVFHVLLSRKEFKFSYHQSF